MDEELDKSILKPYIDMLISKCKLLYGLDTKVLEERLNAISRVVVSSNLNEDTPMSFGIKDRDIKINVRFIPRDENHNYCLDIDKVDDFFKHSMIHELLHAASSSNTQDGIMAKTNDGHKRALNEGITQLLTDDICGYYENKFLGSYNFEKIIATIMRVSYGNEKILQSYFYDKSILDKEIENSQISKIFSVVLHVGLSRYRFRMRTERRGVEDVLLRQTVLNIIIPTYRSLSEDKRKDYLSKLIYEVSGDERLKSKLIEYINEYLNYNLSDSIKEFNRLFDELDRINTESEVMGDLPNISRLVARDDGRVFTIGTQSKEITSKENLEKIYVRLFELNGYSKYMTFELIKRYITFIKQGKSLNIGHDSILKRRMLYCGIKHHLEKEGYILLNDYEDVDNRKSIKVDYINRKLTYKDYKAICEHFSLCKTKVGKNEYTYSVIHNSTKNELEDPILRRAAFFALNWLHTIQDKGRDGIDEAFNEENYLRFYGILSKFYELFENNSEFDLNALATNGKISDIIRRLLESPVQLEWVHDYINLMSKFSSPLKERKGLSAIEIEDKGYLQRRSEEEAEYITSRNR